MSLSYALFVNGTPLMAEYTPGADISGGDVKVIGNVCRIAHRDIKSGILGALAVAGGIYRMPKATGGSTAIADGVQLYWDDTNKVVTATAGSNKKIGVSIGASLDADAYQFVHHQGSV